MATTDVSFAGGTAPVEPIGQKSKIRFAYTWADSETWSIEVTSTLTGDFTLGLGNIAGQTFTSLGKFRDRVFVGFASSFAMSGVGAPTGWEEQNAGAAVVSYLSQFGSQDTVSAFATLQGRLAVFGAKSIQMWDTDANPNNFALQQTMDNTGTSDPLSVQSIGDLDVLFLDRSGIRSLRAKESTLNAYINDMGTAIDSLVRTKIRSYTEGEACGVVEPTTRQYWLFIHDTIYVLSYYPQSKVAAWSTYDPSYVSTVTPTDATYSQQNGSLYFARYTVVAGATYYWVKGSGESEVVELDFGISEVDLRSDTGGFAVGTNTTTIRVYGPQDAAVTGTLYRVDTPFVPRKFVTHNDQVYCLASGGKVYRYGGSDNNTFDRCRLRAELPWLSMNLPSQFKQFLGLDAAFYGRWELYMGSNPRATTFTKVMHRGSDSDPLTTTDSTYDVGHFGYSGHGTHVKVRAESFDDVEAKLGKLVVLYEQSNMK